MDIAKTSGKRNDAFQMRCQRPVSVHNDVVQCGPPKDRAYGQVFAKRGVHRYLSPCLRRGAPKKPFV
jgi:hypothetical protein